MNSITGNKVIVMDIHWTDRLSGVQDDVLKKVAMLHNVLGLNGAIG
ncbi:hypothetical protein QUF90_06645 [Desulfococcaceae bacterium HSG9]|nr:hypothetical protein [Desulfococcaceae bacterium HSG9]